ncbi:hypothetical protein CPB84DRAFT_1750854 [Gymnopilus junonius]|uniref:Uncharacterized protein n=1 Tax=Gymnopilus junonius TaxID=109634 RepID=A0A9P5NCV6_GYMJU|nr:hypothetical protein CPB84DRAFT_1750854 [Gymnopilus junonius]
MNRLALAREVLASSACCERGREGEGEGGRYEGLRLLSTRGRYDGRDGDGSRRQKRFPPPSRGYTREVEGRWHRGGLRRGENHLCLAFASKGGGTGWGETEPQVMLARERWKEAGWWRVIVTASGSHCTREEGKRWWRRQRKQLHFAFACDGEEMAGGVGEGGGKRGVGEVRCEKSTRSLHWKRREAGEASVGEDKESTTSDSRLQAREVHRDNDCHRDAAFLTYLSEPPINWVLPCHLPVWPSFSLLDREEEGEEDAAWWRSSANAFWPSSGAPGTGSVVTVTCPTSTSPFSFT